MLDADAPLLKVALVAGLLAVAPLSGCLEPIGEATQQALAGENATQQKTAPEAEDEAELAEDEIAATYEAALSPVDAEDTDDEPFERAHITMDVESLEDAPEESAHFEVSIDDAEEVFIMSLEDYQTGDSEELAGLEAGESILFGVVHKTTLAGVPPELVATYDANSTWENVTGTDSSDEEASPSSSQPLDDIPEPDEIVEDLEDVPDGAEIEARTVEHEGEQRLEITLQHDNGTESMDVRLLVDTERELPVLLEATYREAEEVTSIDEGAHVRAAFAYGEDASYHDYREELIRLEAMTIHDEAGETFSYVEINETETWTLKPSKNPGLVPLEEVEVQLRGTSGGFASDSEAKLTLPAEEGQLVTEDATLAYEDVDGDGHVSPGDEVRFTPHTEQAQGWSIAMHDEETGMRTVPGPGLGALVAGLAGLGLVARRRA